MLPIKVIGGSWLAAISLFAYARRCSWSNSNSSRVLNNTIDANNTWAFYQAKSIKGTLAEMALDDAMARKDVNKVMALSKKIARYESDPATGEGKKELMEKARQLEADRAVAKQRSPWYTYAGSLFQIAIVLLTASILSVKNSLYRASIGVGTFALVLMSQAIWLWIPAVL